MAERGVLSNWYPVLAYEEQIESVRTALNSLGYKYAMICHDKDKSEDGTIKKSHWHIVVLCEKREWQSSFAKRLGLEMRFVQHPLSSEPNGAMRYLTHTDNPEKAQYRREDIDTNLSKENLESLFQKKIKRSKEEENEFLIEDIEALAKKTISYKDFFRAHPSFIYQANSLVKLVQIASDFQWNSSVDKKTGEII